jgi:hypothetical protein
MTTIQLSVEGPFAQEVLSDVLGDLSLDEANHVSVTIQFDGFALSAESDSIETAAEKFNSITYNDEPSGFDVDIELTEAEAAVETMGESDVIDDSEDESDGDDDDSDPIEPPRSPPEYDDGVDKYDRPHSAHDPAHLRENTMEHLSLGLMAEYLRQTEDVDSAFDATGVMVDPREFINWEASAVDITESQGTNALFRLWKKGLLERDKRAGDNGRAFAYELNRAGAAEIERLGEVDPDEFGDHVFDDE